MYLAEEAQWPKSLEAITQFLTFIALVVGGIFGLRRYLHSLRVKTAEILMGMEKEYRNLLPICLQIEQPDSYHAFIKPALDKFEKAQSTHATLTDVESKTLEELDRALRFFYICTVLHGELHVEQNVIGRVYYYYLGILADSNSKVRPELKNYVEKYYIRLYRWLIDYKPYLDYYKKTGTWGRPRKEEIHMELE